MNRAISLAVASSLSIALLAACASSGRSSAESTVTGLGELRGDATAGKTQIKTTIATMDQIEKSESGDLKPLYDSFKKEVANLESLASKARSNGQAMREKGAAYFKTWEEQLGTMTNEDIKKRSEERRKELNALYAELTKSMDACRTSYDKLSTNLSDITKALDLDLSKNGVKNLATPMKSARTNAADVDKAISAVEKNLDALAKEMSSIQAAKS